ncbi:beta-lactamase hydrolase domain-containing protein [Limobrevibacterium gyesilva]|uniref:Sulfur transferase domain-containing protein n=1 Tax=Limobrevibacterium gyesilva TaxID=2991712 RepID=A0AA41YNK0_9PROT|nr:sulfur transferase domain-containing protein [Limobrevibacterium gyesilva]
MFRGDLASPGGRALAWLDSMLVDHGALRLVWSNWGVVVPGRLYRCNHPTPGRLARAARRYGLRSVINLRGATRSGSDALSREQAGRLGLAFFDVPMSSGHAPSRERLLALAEALRTAPAPVLLHCKSGADRAGFAASVFVLLEGGTTAQALRHLSLRFGHLRRSRAGVLDALLLRYAAEAEGRKSFLDWVREEYDAADLTRSYRAGHFASFLTERILARE